LEKHGAEDIGHREIQPAVGSRQRSDIGGRGVGEAISRDGNWIMKHWNDLEDCYDFYDLKGLNDFNELTNPLIL
jgi:hypothetical protein